MNKNEIERAAISIFNDSKVDAINQLRSAIPGMDELRATMIIAEFQRRLGANPLKMLERLVKEAVDLPKIDEANCMKAHLQSALSDLQLEE